MVFGQTRRKKKRKELDRKRDRKEEGWIDRFDGKYGRGDSIGKPRNSKSQTWIGGYNTSNEQSSKSNGKASKSDEK